MEEKSNKFLTKFIVSSVAISILMTLSISLGVYFGTRPKPLNDIDNAKIDELNKVLILDEEENNKNLFVGEAIGDFKDKGISSYLPFNKNNNFYWIEEDNRVLNFTKDEGVTYPIEAKNKYKELKESSIPNTWHNLKDGCIHYWSLGDSNEYICSYCKEDNYIPVLNYSYEENVKPGENLQIENLGGGKHPELKINEIAFKYVFGAVDTVESANEKGIGNYYVDFIVSFYRKDKVYEKDVNDSPIAVKKSSVGLWGAYGTIKTAFYLPYDFKPGEKMALLSSVDKDYMWSYALLIGIVGNFSCGAFNCDLKNDGLTMKVELCMWDKEKIKNSVIPLNQIDPDIELGTYEYTFTNKVNVSNIENGV